MQVNATLQRRRCVPASINSRTGVSSTDGSVEYLTLIVSSIHNKKMTHDLSKYMSRMDSVTVRCPSIYCFSLQSIDEPNIATETPRRLCGAYILRLSEISKALYFMMLPCFSPQIEK